MHAITENCKKSQFLRINKSIGDKKNHIYLI